MWHITREIYGELFEGTAVKEQRRILTVFQAYVFEFDEKQCRNCCQRTRLDLPFAFVFP